MTSFLVMIPSTLFPASVTVRWRNASVVNTEYTLVAGKSAYTASGARCMKLATSKPAAPSSSSVSSSSSLDESRI